jgi:hypothetical protein
MGVLRPGTDKIEYVDNDDSFNVEEDLEDLPAAFEVTEEEK